MFWDVALIDLLRVLYSKYKLMIMAHYIQIIFHEVSTELILQIEVET